MVCHVRNSNADLLKLIVSRSTLQYNPFVFIGDFTKPQIRELDVDKSADVVYIHIMVKEQRSRMDHATDARGSCGATEGVRGAVEGGGGRGEGAGAGIGMQGAGRAGNSVV